MIKYNIYYKIDAVITDIIIYYAAIGLIAPVKNIKQNIGENIVLKFCF